eukprot:TRINITY_DN7257_c0_g1_i1.p1 TRINITY_DN7257_c0_g1~~TRINITY_DN7257_c0_g1_i1.p1  ORF type:complete len:309 (-),score=21.73 TRINITY_DN7257_c0_g1_i1:207-1133(-)
MYNFLRVLGCLRQPVCSLPCPSNDIDLSGKTVIVTGGNVTMGREVTSYFALHGAKTIVGCRRIEAGNEAIEYVQNLAQQNSSEQIKPVDISVHRLDLADLASVKQFCDDVRVELGPNKKVDILICHAGIASRHYELSEQGVEIHFAVNHLGHFCLTQNLINSNTISKDGRVVIVSGDIHVLASGDPDPNLIYQGTNRDAYDRAKTANIMHAYALQRKYPDLNVVTLHPGVVDTDLMTHGKDSGTVAWLKKKVLISPKEGAQTTCYRAVASDLGKGILPQCVGKGVEPPSHVRFSKVGRFVGSQREIVQ